MSVYIKDQWVKVMTRSMCMAHPEMSKDDVRKKVIKIFDKKFIDHDAVMYNNYEETIANVTLSKMVDWFQDGKPLICESGVYFMPKSIKRNINAEIVKENMLDARKVHKKEMFECLDKGDEFGASVKNIQQANDKKAANSQYGASAESSSFLYNLHAAMSVTSCGRGQLSTACQCVENLLEDNVKFFNMDEFYTWVDHICSEQDDWKFITNEIITIIPSKKQFVKRFKSKFYHEQFCDEDKIGKVFDGLDPELMVRVYYKANLREFLMNAYPMWTFGKISSANMKAKDDFVDPNVIPEKIRPYVQLLVELVTEFVAYKYSIFRYEDRTRYQKRKAIIVMDTDSVFVYYRPMYDFVIANVLPKKLKRKDVQNVEKERAHHIRILNVLACFVNEAIKTTLWNYTTNVNIEEEDRHYINMKNEFYYERIIITHAKKSYIGLQLRQESHLFDPPKLDVKGVNFFKSTASASTSDFIYKDILMDQLLRPKDGKIKLGRVIKTIQKFQDGMADAIEDGDMGYLKRSIRVKSPDAYANPLSNGSYKAVYVWNKVMPDKDRIEVPATVTLVKVNLQKREDCAKLEQWPDIYENMLELFDNDPEVGGTVVDGKRTKVKGVKAIALPTEYDDVPEWVLAIIDTETLVADNMKLMTQLYRPLGMVPGSSRHNGNSMEYYTNVVRI